MQVLIKILPMNIKWNWGTKLTIAIILFMSFIFGLVYMTTKNSIILVEKDYYPKGIAYQDKIDKTRNAREFHRNMVLKEKDQQIILSIPGAIPDSGAVVFYRPDQEKAKDYVYPLPSGAAIDLSFPKSKFKRGIYILKITWWKENKGYFIEEKIFLN
jgi:hypothetical protein